MEESRIGMAMGVEQIKTGSYFVACVASLYDLLSRVRLLTRTFAPCISSILLCFTLLGCSTSNCRKARPVPGTLLTPEAPVEKKAGTEGKKILVYKYDGGLQCGMGKTISLEDMAKDLGKIQVLSQQKRPDGLMHIQMCGSPTGIANVYEIFESDLSRATAAGFKAWSFD